MKRFAAVLLLLASIGCGDSTGPEDVAGRYTLRTINNAPPPVIVDEAVGYRLEITGGEVNLDSDESFSDITLFRETFGTQVTTDSEVAVGDYVISGNTVTFTTTDGDSYSMTLSGRTLTQNVQGIIFVYQR
jgi:hypothetical protein